MAKGDIHPYIPSAGMLVQTFNQLRSMFPIKVDADTLKKMSIAPKNESMVISTLKFLNFVDDDGNKTEVAKSVFLKHEDKAFQSALEKIVKTAYSSLFENLGDMAWKIERNKLISFFRVQDETSALTAKRQAIAFETLASLAGHGETPVPKKTKPAGTTKQQNTVSQKKEKVDKKTNIQQPSVQSKDIGLTVRIEVNLPAQGDQATYDSIFRSIKENLLNG